MSIEEARAQLRARLVAENLAVWADPVLEVARPALLLHPREKTPGIAPIGSTKIGGAPDLPENFVWPLIRRPNEPKRSLFSWGKKPESGPSEIDIALPFIAQINLSECRVADELDLPLPGDGMLSLFFIDLKETYEFRPGLSGGTLLVWHAPTTTLVRRQTPEGACEYPEYQLVPKPIMKFPSHFFMRKDLADDQFEQLATWNEREPEGIQLGGWPTPVQSAMEPECESAKLRSEGKPPHDINWKNYSGQTWDWRLVLQIDSNRQFKMVWGHDWGSLYVWMQNADIRDRRFANAGTIEQSH